MFAVPTQGTGELAPARETEIAQLTGTMEALRHRRGSVVEITGEPGIGKTHLASALADLAARHGFPVARARAVGGSTTRHQVFRDAWAALLGWCHGADDKGRLFHEGGVLPAEWADGGVLLLDDAHLCDPASAELVARLVRTPVPGPFVLALTHRPRQTDPALLEALDEEVRAGTVTRIEPGPLDAEAVATLLDTWRTSGRTGPDDAARLLEMAPQLCNAAEGNPQYLRLLVAAGWQPDYWPDRPGTYTDRLLREARPLMAELNALTPEAAIAAAAGSVLGCPFRPEDVAEISGLGLEHTLDALAELTREDVVRPAGWGGRLSFRHRVVGHVAHESADLSFRLRAHLRAMDMLYIQGGQASERARHAEHLLGTDSPTALRVLSEGAEDIVSRAPATAARWLGLALEALPGHGRAGMSRAALALARCRALTAAGRLEEARALAHDVLASRSSLTLEQQLTAHAVCVDTERLLGRYEEAEAIAETALGLLPRPWPDPLPAEAFELFFEYGLVLVLRGGHEQAGAVVSEVSQARTEADDAARTAMRVLAAFCDTYLGHLDEAAPDVTRCARLVDALPDSVAGHTPETLTLLGCAELYLERYADAFRHLSRKLGVTMGASQKHIAMHKLLGLSMLDQWAGRLEDAQRRALEAEAQARAIGAPDAAGLAMALRASALVWSHERQSIGDIVDLTEAAARAITAGRGWWATSATGLLAQTRLICGDSIGSRRILLDCGGGEGLPLVPPTLRPSLLALLAAVELKCGDTAAARHHVREAETYAQKLGLPVQDAYVRRTRALLHVNDREHDAAAKLFELSAEDFRRARMPVEYAWTLVTGARSANAVHGPASAAAWLDTAEAAARTCGAVRLEKEAARVRAELPRSPQVPRPINLLSDREREIAELAAAGLRSRQIAERLFLSPRTVESHLNRAYRKLHVSSRVALAHVLHGIG
ncbi:helix-turn-helix transcriptional regulator [Streptomyces sp. PSKA54]|uniref:Helix-turn-helix transcriptional regulator n=1 Tax=Streptomyces himalayensis subsp. aureolus TaxID=2758039 RepID=A0A7W2D8Y1_9ACTN|nr:LuxR family transcriptional regulator [Streptomyces himalayensis]MBA4866913.1 helix-turn-helix transcriptional regulator [Streptomyces himalayensis subsp. aureolus]